MKPGALKVDMVCDDYNLAQNLNPRDPNWANRQFNEVMFIKRLDAAAIAVDADFEERCLKFSDTVVSIARRSIVTASNKCDIHRTRVQLPDTVRTGADCTLQPASNGDAVGVQNVDTTPDRENLMFKKIDDKTVILWIINNEHFAGDGRKLSYCSDQVQRAYAGQRRTNKQTKN